MKKKLPKIIKSGCKVGGNKRVKKSELLIPTMVNILEIFNEFLRVKKNNCMPSIPHHLTLNPPFVFPKYLIVGIFHLYAIVLKTKQ